jgi:hypothetical protein
VCYWTIVGRACLSRVAAWTPGIQLRWKKSMIVGSTCKADPSKRQIASSDHLCFAASEFTLWGCFPHSERLQKSPACSMLAECMGALYWRGNHWQAARILTNHWVGRKHVAKRIASCKCIDVAIRVGLYGPHISIRLFGARECFFSQRISGMSLLSALLFTGHGSSLQFPADPFRLRWVHRKSA